MDKKKALWGGVALVLGSGCTAILGIDKDYHRAEAGGVGGSSASSATSSNGSGGNCFGMGTSCSETGGLGGQGGATATGSGGAAGTGSGSGSAATGIGTSDAAAGTGTGGAAAGTGAGGAAGTGAGGPTGCTEGAMELCYTGDPTLVGKGECKAGTRHCTGGQWGSCDNEVLPKAEVCNGRDDDCNQAVDDGNVGAGQACTTGSLGVCAPGTTACTGGMLKCVSNVMPSAEVCDGKDNNCNGIVDDGIHGGICPTGLEGICSVGHKTCTDGVLYCKQDNEPQPEIPCNMLDDDCNGIVDECFVAGTRIAMADGSTHSIDQINVGDWVLGYDFATAKVVSAPVVQTFVHPLHSGSRSIVRINELLSVTENHPFYASGRWVAAGRLLPGDALLTIDTSEAVGVSLSSTGVLSLIAESERATTYNIEVAKVHNYFAGGILVHNKTVCP